MATAQSATFPVKSHSLIVIFTLRAWRDA